MKISVFGGCGFVGSHFVKKLAEMQDRFVVMCSDIFEKPVPNVIHFKKANVLLRDEVAEVMKGSEATVNLAASNVMSSLNNPRENMRVNVEGMLNILDAARQLDVGKIIYSSASGVIGEVKRNPVDEEHLCRPKNPYAVSKLACEHYIRVYSEMYGLDYLIFRFFNVYGPGQSPGSGAIIPNILTKLMSGEAIKVTGDGTQTRDFVYVGDVADFCIKALELNKPREIANLGTGQSTSLNELIDICSKIVGGEPLIQYVPRRLGEITNFCADITKLRRIFGVTPSTPLPVGLRLTYESIQQSES